jgi:hypothetical protein
VRLRRVWRARDDEWATTLRGGTNRFENREEQGLKRGLPSEREATPS